MAIRITRVYTRTGDRGETGLVGGERVPKDAPRIEAYGTVDELNAAVGLARAFSQESLPQGEARRFLDRRLREIQSELFDLGSELATPPDYAHPPPYRVGNREVKRIEAAIDQCQKELEPLRSFVLPGGGKVAAGLHQCRTVCRRAEREIARLSRREPVGEWPLKYLNRLSDLFFVLSRWIARRMGEKEELWQHGLNQSARKRSRFKG